MSNMMFVSRHLVAAEPVTYGEFLERCQEEGDSFSEDTPGFLLQVGDNEYAWIEASEFEEDHLPVGDLDGLEPYQQRLLAERAVLSTNYSQLSKAFNRNTFLALPYLDRQLLEKQHRAMEAYLRILNERITKFLH